MKFKTKNCRSVRIYFNLIYLIFAEQLQFLAILYFEVTINLRQPSTHMLENKSAWKTHLMNCESLLKKWTKRLSDQNVFRYLFMLFEPVKGTCLYLCACVSQPPCIEFPYSCACVFIYIFVFGFLVTLICLYSNKLLMICNCSPVDLNDKNWIWVLVWCFTYLVFV